MTSSNDNLDSLYEIIVERNEELTDKQKQILAAAIEAFAEQGYSATSTRQIAESAGVSEGTIFRQYRTKKDLLRAIVTPLFSTMVAPLLVKDMEQLFNTEFDRFEDLFRHLLTNRLAFARRNLLILRIFVQEVAFHEDLRQEFQKRVASQVVPRFQKVIRHYQAKGQIVDWPVESVMRLVISAGVSYILSRYIVAPDVDWDDEAEIERTVRFVIKGLQP